MTVSLVWLNRVTAEDSTNGTEFTNVKRETANVKRQTPNFEARVLSAVGNKFQVAQVCK
jgi:cell division septum initiation protein DivIVA